MTSFPTTWAGRGSENKCPLGKKNKCQQITFRTKERLYNPRHILLDRISPRTFVETCDSESCLPMGMNGNCSIDISMEALAWTTNILTGTLPGPVRGQIMWRIPQRTNSTTCAPLSRAIWGLINHKQFKKKSMLSTIESQSSYLRFPPICIAIDWLSRSWL